MRALPRLFILFTVIALAAGIGRAVTQTTDSQRDSQGFSTSGTLAIGNPTSINLTTGESLGSFDCSTLQKRRVRFSDPGYAGGNRVGLFYSFEGVPAGHASLEIFWDEVGKPTEKHHYPLGQGETQRNDDGLSDHTGIIDYTYAGVVATESKVVRANLIVLNWDNNCPTVRRVTVSPGTGGKFLDSASLGAAGPGETNGNSGVAFDLISTLPIRLDSFSVELKTARAGVTFQAWYRVGTANGNSGSRAGWTLFDDKTGVTTLGEGEFTPVPLGGLILAPNVTYGIFIDVIETYTVLGQHDLQYKDGGPTAYSNDDLTLTTYAGISLHLDPWELFEFREFSGAVHYSK